MTMTCFKQNSISEFLKIIYSRSTAIILLIIFLLQPFVAYISAKQMLDVGLDASPETTSSLLEAIPPVEYIGFDSILLGLFAMVVLGALLGSLEYKKNSIRSSLLWNPNKSRFFFVKFLTTIVFVFVISLLSIYLSIFMSQFALGSEGLNPLILNEKTWGFILLGSLSWTLLTLLSFLMSFFFQSPVVSLLFLIPQLYNLGNFLAERIDLAKFLPVALGQSIIATSPEKMTDNYLMTILFLSLWLLLFAVLAFSKFVRVDVGSR